LLFRRFEEDCLEDTDVVHFLGFLGLYDHTPPAEVRREFAKIKNAAQDIDDTQFAAFLQLVQTKFQDYIDRSI